MLVNSLRIVSFVSYLVVATASASPTDEQKLRQRQPQPQVQAQAQARGVNGNVKAEAVTCANTPMTGVDHLIYIVEENHSFDFYFGKYCTAEPYSNPTCNYGPSCCEGAPTSAAMTWGTMYPTTIYNGGQGSGCDHSESGTLSDINGGAWNNWPSSGTCFQVSDTSSLPKYTAWASQYALADRFFQSACGASYEGASFFAYAKYMFSDNSVSPSRCGLYAENYGSSVYGGPYTDENIGSLMDTCDISWKAYVSSGACNGYIPFAFSTLIDQAKHFREFNTYFVADIQAGKLPSVSFIKPSNTYNGKGSMTNEEYFTNNIVSAIMNSPIYQNNTLIFITHDEHGGFYDHVARGGNSGLPLTSAYDGKYYGPRIPAIAIGNMVKKNYISHVSMEATSIIKFIEYNWFGGVTGHLGARDADKNVNNLFDLIIPAALTRPSPKPTLNPTPGPSAEPTVEPTFAPSVLPTTRVNSAALLANPLGWSEGEIAAAAVVPVVILVTAFLVWWWYARQTVKKPWVNPFKIPFTRKYLLQAASFTKGTDKGTESLLPDA